MATTPTPNPPSYRSPLVQPNLIVAKDWLRWFNQLQISAAAVTNVETALAALQAEVTSIETSVTKLSAAIAAVELAQLQAASALADLTLVVATLQGLVAQHTYLLTTQQAEIDALTAAAGDGGAADLFGDSTFDFTPQIGGLQNLFATLDTPRDWLREIEELRRYVATLDASRDWLREIEELRRYIAMLDVPSQGGLSGGPFDPLGSAAAAQAASDPLGMALLWSDPPRDWLREIEELRRYVATLDMPLSIGLLNGLFVALGAAETLNIRTVNASSSVTSTDYSIDADATTAALTVTYPLTPAPGRILNVKKIDTTVHVVTLNGNGSNIEGGATLAIALPQLSLQTQFDGAQWRIF